jgi:hypothetical protein
MISYLAVKTLRLHSKRQSFCDVQEKYPLFILRTIKIYTNAIHVQNVELLTVKSDGKNKKHWALKGLN